MENKVIQERLCALRDAMQNAGVDFYLIPTADYHNSEYVSDFFKVREYFCGFTGSNGTLVVWRDGVGLWTDGRYFIQAEKELEGTGVELFRMMNEGVPTIEEFLKEKMQNGQTLGFDGMVVSTGIGLGLEKALKEKGIKFLYDNDIAGSLWRERPSLPAGEVRVLPEEITGLSYKEKLAQVMEKAEQCGAEAFFLSKLDDLMWLFNIRGCDVECNPVALAYGYFTKEESVLFVQNKALNLEVKSYLSANNIVIKEYADVAEHLRALPEGNKVLVDKRYTSYALYKCLTEKQELVEKNNPTELLKSVKNPVELQNMEKIYIKDSVAVTRFIYWLKQNIGKVEITEISAADKLEEFRREIPEFLDLSFPTISAYKENAAMMHYQATEDNYKELAPEGMLLIDCGGQYLGGTTDVTRTFALGPVTEEMKKHYTAVAMGMLRLLNGRFLYGCTGRNLDILARGPLWDMNIDYKCGTGHGIGYILNVHEGPQNVRWRFLEGMKEVPLEEGMVLSNEPGVYIEGSHGIRTENIMVTKNGEKNGDGQFMYFESLTFAPIDLDLIDTSVMEKKDIENLNRYHKEVYEKIAPLMTEEEAVWLKEVTREIC